MRPFVGPLRMEGSRERLFKPCKFSWIVRGAGEWRRVSGGEGEWRRGSGGEGMEEEQERGKEKGERVSGEGGEQGMGKYNNST